jgi:hypothetical protein
MVQASHTKVPHSRTAGNCRPREPWTAGGEQRVDADTANVVGRLAQERWARVVKEEAGGSETTRENITSRRQAEATAHAFVRLVPDASMPRGARQGGQRAMVRR